MWHDFGSQESSFDKRKKCRRRSTVNRIGSLAITITAIVVGLAGCTSSGGTATFHDPEKLHQMRVNKSTKQQVKGVLGEPQSITVHSNETESWAYQSTHTTYTEKYAAKTALSFVPIPYLGTAAGLADRVVDAGPDKRGVTQTLTLTFSKRGILKETKRETKHF